MRRNLVVVGGTVILVSLANAYALPPRVSWLGFDVATSGWFFAALAVLLGYSFGSFAIHAARRSLPASSDMRRMENELCLALIAVDKIKPYAQGGPLDGPTINERALNWEAEAKKAIRAGFVAIRAARWARFVDVHVAFIVAVLAALSLAYTWSQSTSKVPCPTHCSPTDAADENASD